METDLYVINCYVYEDTRMGATNPSYNIGDAYNSLASVKEAIENYFKIMGTNKPVPDIILDSTGCWRHDFLPEIITVRKLIIK